MAEHLAEVVRRPAFIAGVGGACWVILAAFAAWLYSRRRRNKELSHFAASFAYTPTGKPIRGPAGTRHGPSPPSPPPLSTVTFPAPARGSPRAAATGGYPWLADMWRGSGVAGASGCLGTTERYYNEAGITRYIAQTEQFGAGTSEGPVYSTIEAGGEELRTFPRPFSQHGTPYLGGGPQPMDAPAPQAPHGRAEHGAKRKKLGQAVKPPAVSWTELLPPPPSASELSQCTQEEEEEEEDEEEEAAGGLGTEEWYPSEHVPCATAASSPAASSACQSTATLTPSPHATEDIPCLRDFDSSGPLWRPPHGAATPLQAPSPLPSPDDGDGHRPQARRPLGTGKTRGETPKSRLKPKCSRYHREKQPGDLPPPPLPPPGETPSPSLERELSGAERKVTHRPHRRDEVTPYGKLSCLPRGQASGSCSTTGSISSRGSTGSRGHGSGRSRTLGDRGEGTNHRRRPGPPFPCSSQEKQ